MSEAQAQDATPEVDGSVNHATVPNEGTEQTGSAPDASGADEGAIEAEALAMGWKPQSSFKGPADKFVTAAEYIERGKTIMPFLRKELVRRDREIEGLKKAVDSSIQHISRAEQRAYAKAKADLEAELAQYAEAGNVKAVKEVTDDLIALEAAKTPAAATANANPEWFTAWQDDNPWFGQGEGKDAALTAATVAIANESEADGYTGKALAKEVDRRLREQFPTKFEKATNPNRERPGTVETGGAARPTRGKGYADLPAEAKAMCDSFVRDIKGFTREKFVRDYDWS